MTMRRQVAVFGTLLGLALVAARPAHAAPVNLLLDPGFEDAVPAWTASGDVSAHAAYPVDATNVNPVVDGGFMAAFNAGDKAPNGVISQSVTTVAGVQYTLSFFYGDFNANGGASSQSILASADNGVVTLGSLTATDSPATTQKDLNAIYGPPNPFSFTFIATGATTNISFSDLPASQTISSDGFLENVSLVVNGPEVNVTSAAAPLALAAGVLALYSDRRRSTTAA